MAWERKARLGLLIPPVNVIMEPELSRWAPPPVTVHAHRLYRTRAVLTVESLMEMIERLEESASLLAMARADLMVFGCTSGSLLEGVGWDQRLVARMEAATGIPSIATATAVVEALRALGIQRVAVATPYPEEVNRREAAFLEQSGISVLSLESLGHVDSYRIPATSPEEVYRLARSADRPEAQAIFISCTNFPTAEVIDRLEADTGKPVVTSNQASLWLALKRLGIAEPVLGAGMLLAGLAAGPVSSQGSRFRTPG